MARPLFLTPQSALNGGKYQADFSFVFPTAANRSDFSPRPPGPASVSRRGVDRLPPSMSAKSFSISTTLTSDIEYIIEVVFVKFGQRPRVVSNSLFLTFVPPRKRFEEFPKLYQEARCRLLTVDNIFFKIPAAHSCRDLLHETISRLFPSGLIPTLCIDVRLHIPSMIVPGTGPDILGYLEATGEGSAADSRPIVELRDIRVVLTAYTLASAGEETKRHQVVVSQGKFVISAAPTPTPLSWGDPEPVARIFNKQVGSDGNRYPITPTFAFGYFERTHKLTVEMTVVCLRQEHRLKFNSVPVRIFSPFT